MANPYFNAVYYLQQNPDVFSAGYTVATAWDHYVKHGANEANVVGGTFRAPNPWFDVKYYLANNPDLVRAGITPATALDHFLNYGSKTAEDRAPNATIAAAPITEAKLLTYVKANADLQTAFGIAAGATTLTPAQENALITHFYSYGYNETRPSKPAPVTTPDANEGKTFTLTKGADNIVGTSGDDTISGVADSVANEGTFNASDAINGGAGNDTLNVTVLDAAIFKNAQLAIGISNVENVFVKTAVDISGAGDEINATVFGGVQQLWSNASSNKFKAINVTTATTAGIKGNTAETVEFAFKDVGGTSDTATLALSDAKVTAGKAVTIAGIETLNISATGTSSADTFVAADTKTLNVSGTGQVTLGGATTATDLRNVTKINAADNSGGVSVNLALGAGANAKDVTFTGGKGNDTVAFDYAQLNKADKIDGGEGTDTVTVVGASKNETIGTTSAAASGKAVAEAINAAKNVEVLGLTNAGTGGTAAESITVTASELNVTKFAVAGAATGQGGFIFDGVKANSEFTIKGAVAVDAVTLDVNAGTGVTSTTLNLIAGSTAANGNVTVTTVDAAAGFSTLNIVSSGSNSTANTITNLKLADNSTVKISGAQALELTAALLNKTTVNAADLTAKLTLTGSSANDTITVGSGGSALTASTGNDAYTLGAGKDVVTYTNVNQSGNGSTINLDTITSFGSNDQLNLNAITGGTWTLKAQSSIQAAVNAGAPATLDAAVGLATTAVGDTGVGAFQFEGNTYVLAVATAAGFTADDMFDQTGWCSDRYS